ncbi:unnamed protein product [Trichobilharzia regenti]|nr:unnamed protein product [Trichobilharzia regenti]
MQNSTSLPGKSEFGKDELSYDQIATIRVVIAEKRIEYQSNLSQLQLQQLRESLRQTALYLPRSNSETDSTLHVQFPNLYQPHSTADHMTMSSPIRGEPQPETQRFI